MEGAQGRSPHTVTFRYRRENSEILGVIKRPVAKIYFGNKGNSWLPCYMYIDSGADFTLVPYKFGLMLGFEIEKKISEVYGVGGGIPVVLKSASIRISDIVLKVRVGWSLREDVPFILGRLDVFRKFNVNFMEKEEKVVFEPVP